MKNKKPCMSNILLKSEHFFLKLFFLFILVILQKSGIAQNVTERIKLNQVGYYPGSSKIAIVTADTIGGSFYITSTNLRDTLFTGKLSEQKQSAYSSTKTRIADFSSFNSTGSYVIFIPGLGHSYVFSISSDVFHEAAVATLKGFYFMRASMPLPASFAGKWHRSAGHPDTSVLVHSSAVSENRPAGTVISSPGGWYDAGDYNKYMVNSGITMATLLSAYEDFIPYFKNLDTNIPESNDAVPDILNEIIYNLRWMLTMQDPSDGGVYHKCTNAAFDAMVMPGVTKAPRYVVQKSTAAALDFTAVTAQSARVLKAYEKSFPGLADSCLRAAANAWQWAKKNPGIIYNQNEINQKFDPGITTGEYGDRYLNDEWMWAAAELYITTNDKKYFDIVDSNINDPISLPSWSNVRMLAYYTFIRNGQSILKYAAPIIKQMEDSVLGIADNFILKSSSNAFATVMGQSVKDFIWGSNAVAANQGILLINAYFISKDKKYLDGALSNLDYLFGRNATGYCFVTGVGSKSPMHPHHRPSEADGITDPVPG
ncbi:MAG TPA: glycoside hydrolase family 9 protein, partial [Chitinophagaceae bacterium]